MRSRLAVLVLVVAVAGCGKTPSVENETLHGTVQVTRTVQYLLAAANALDPKYGGHFVNESFKPGFTEPCFSYDDGFNDLHDGAAVEVQNAVGKTVAITTLANGHLKWLVTKEGGLRCNFDFTVAIPQSDFYKVEVGHRGTTTYSKSDLVVKDWKISLDIG